MLFKGIKVIFVIFFLLQLQPANANTCEEIPLIITEQEKLTLNTKKTALPEINIDKSTPVNTEISKNEQDARMKFFTGINNSLSALKVEEPVSLSSVSPLLKGTLTKHFSDGPVESVHLWGVYQGVGEIDIPEHGETHKAYNPNLVNILIDTKMKSNKDNFRLIFDVSPQHSRPFFQQLIQDAYYENTHIPHHRIIVGNSRPGIVFEGSQSPYTLPLINRSQIARNFLTVRKAGVRINGNYDYIEYDLGGYSSDTYFREFMPGVEFDGFVAVKPFAKHENLGKLTTAGSIVTGKRNSQNYIVGSAFLGYEYKRFWAKAEFAVADGSNGATGLTNARRQGWSATLGYRLTKKLEAVARYDDFIPNKSVKSVHSREFSAGMNYYIKGQALKLALNYVFHQNDIAYNSHRLLMFTQISL